MDPYGTIRFSNVLRGKERVRWEKWFQTDFFRFKLNPLKFMRNLGDNVPF